MHEPVLACYMIAAWSVQEDMSEARYIAAFAISDGAPSASRPSGTFFHPGCAAPSEQNWHTVQASDTQIGTLNQNAGPSRSIDTSGQPCKNHLVRLQIYSAQDFVFGGAGIYIEPAA